MGQTVRVRLACIHCYSWNRQLEQVHCIAPGTPLDILWWPRCEENPEGRGSVQFSGSVVSNSLQSHELQHTRPPCPSPTPGVHPNSCPLSQWCHPAISSSVVPFSSHPQSLPASVSFPMSQLFAWGGQSIGVSASASVLPMNTQDWSPSGWTGREGLCVYEWLIHSAGQQKLAQLVKQLCLNK